MRSHFVLNKLHLKNGWNLHILMCIYDFQRQINIKTCEFHRFFKSNFWAQNVLIPHFLYYWHVLKVFLPLFSTFYQLQPTIILLWPICNTFSTLYHLLSPTFHWFLTFYQLPSLFTNFPPTFYQCHQFLCY